MRDLPARLLIVDDHQRARDGLRTMLAGELNMTVVGEVTSGREALDFCRRMQPDLVLMDLQMPDIDGVTATKVITQVCPSTSVILLTMCQSPTCLVQALEAGAAGYLLKEATQQQIVQAVRQVLRSKMLLT
ncbi:response regulator [Nitrolancea hollandica]|nr:response regulator transcription factor [Nitrolancea hollandica]